MNNKHNPVIVLLILLTISACIPDKHLRNFTLYNQKIEPVNGLKTEGMFLCRREESFPVDKDHPYYYNCFAFYKDGSFLKYNTGDRFINIDSAVSNILTNSKFRKEVGDHLSHWGAFVKKNDTLYIQRFAKGGGWKFEVINDTAVVVNDSTLTMYGNEYSQESSSLQRIKKTYSFYATSLKPDSMNVFKKDNSIKRRLDKIYERRNRLKN